MEGKIQSPLMMKDSSCLTNEELSSPGILKESVEKECGDSDPSDSEVTVPLKRGELPLVMSRMMMSFKFCMKVKLVAMMEMTVSYWRMKLVAVWMVVVEE